MRGGSPVRAEAVDRDDLAARNEDSSSRSTPRKLAKASHAHRNDETEADLLLMNAELRSQKDEVGKENLT